MTTARFNLAVVSVLVFLMLLVPVVEAKNWGGQKADPPPNVMCTEYLNTSECTPNNFTHQVYFSTTYPITDPALDTALRASMANDYDALAGVSVTEIFNNNADVLVQFVTINRNWDMAYTTCQPGATTGYDNIRHYMWCRPQQLVLQNDDSAYTQCWDSAPCIAHYMCHEFGHTLGLQHRPTSVSTSCMRHAPAALTCHASRLSSPR